MECDETNLPPIGAKVELLPGCENVYSRAVSASQGVVRKRQFDEAGFPLVYIEWDKEHWRFNDEEDGWTFASHFKVIGEADPTDTPTPEPEAEDENEISSEVQRAEEYLHKLHAAFEEAIDADGFFIVTFSKDEIKVPGYTSVLPRWYMADLSDDVRKVLENQLTFLAHLAEKQLKDEDS